MFTGLGGASAFAQSASPPLTRAAPQALDVPYLPQSILLCGGAALAMVERWWGRRGVFAEDFAALVHPELGGIRTGDLANAARARGWETRVLRGTPEQIRKLLESGEPVVALIQVAPARFHFVVLLGWSGGTVTYHDPARGPFLTLDESSFLTRWSGADRWAMVIRPAGPPTTKATVAPDPAPVDSLPCPPWLDRAVDAANLKNLPEAERLLDQAGRVCPDQPLVLRETAGVRFKQGRYADAAAIAGQYLERVPADAAGWQLLASSRYLAGDAEGALAAWNQLGRPTVDLLRIDGTRGIRFKEIAGAASVPVGTVLTPSTLALARRRVSEVPALRRASVAYQPVPGGIVEVRVAVVERPVMDRGWRIVAAGAIRALAQQEAALDVATPTGAGELWSGSWRWAESRPRAAFGVDIPGRVGFPGVLGLEGTSERFRFPNIEETRRTGAVRFGGWLTANLRPTAELRVERWSEHRDYLALSAGTELRALANRLALTVTGARALATSAQRSYSTGSARAMWVSAPDLGRPEWSARFGVEWAGNGAPAGAWPVAGGAMPWAVPLRAHSLDEATLLAGRGIVHGGVAGDYPVARMGPLVFAAGAFVDAARLSAPFDAVARRTYVDGGLGLRIGLGDGSLGVLRIDYAHGLMDRSSALSVGVHRSWPLFERAH